MVIQYILVPTCVLALIGVWVLFRKRKISVRAVWAWSALWSLGLAFVLFPDLASIVAQAVGVGRGVDVVVYAAIILLFYLVFRIYLRLDRMEREITVLVRQLSVEQAEEEYDLEKDE